MPEYIKLEPLRDEILNDTDPAYDSDTINHFLGIVDSQPVVDVVEVVRCKDCEHLTEKGICEKFRQRYPFYPEDDFHCGFGKRKEGAEK